jgi:hypothetical protein
MIHPDEILLELPNFQYGPGTLDEKWNAHTVSDNNLFPVVPFLWGPYWPRMEVFPITRLVQANGGPGAGLNPRQQFEDSVRMPVSSFLLGLSAVSPQAAGFRFTLFDAGRNDWVLSPQWVQSQTITPRGKPYFLIRPYAIVDAGMGWGKINLRMVNLATVSNDCQLLMYFAVPAGVRRHMLDPGKSFTTDTAQGNW